MRAHARVVWAMLRGPVLFLLVLYAVCGLTVAGSTSPVAFARVVLVLLPFLVHSAVVNDLADARIDAVNLPDDARRVLTGGRAHRGQLRAVAQTVRAQRKSISAMQEQLDAFDQQMAVFERILDPLVEWSATWARLEEAVGDFVRPGNGDSKGAAK